MKTDAKQKRRTEAGNEKEAPEENGGQMDQALHKLFLSQLADVYNAEQQLTKALPKMAKGAESSELREAFESHLEETRQHVSRLEEVFQSLDERIEKKVCAAMQGLIEEAEEMAKEEKNSSALDAALIAAAQKVEHYEIATYGTLVAWAKQMGHDEAAQQLSDTLEEEKEADEKLTSIAEASANMNGQGQRSSTETDE